MFPSHEIQPNHPSVYDLLCGSLQKDAPLAHPPSLNAALARPNNLPIEALLEYNYILQKHRLLSNTSHHPSLNPNAMLNIFIDPERVQQENQSLAAEIPCVSQLHIALAQAQTRNRILLGSDSLVTNSLGYSSNDVMRQNAMISEAMISEAFQRGKDEAAYNLLNSSASDQSIAYKLLNSSARDQSILKAQPPSQQSFASKIAVAPPDQIQSISERVHKVTEKSIDAPKEISATRYKRNKKNVCYFDASTLPDPDKATQVAYHDHGGVSEPFPKKLQRLIQEAEANGESDIISFSPHGRAFVIHDEGRFYQNIMPRYFRQTRFSSFQRQLNLYGFKKIKSGPDAKGYYHELFLKGRPALTTYMKRLKKSQKLLEISSNTMTSSNSSSSPDFYSMTPIKKVE
mmetsp:Transcript_2667/g.3059  ORF Transcript_2667/g.3059 Transcript_2667/m.3059 type:complete len:401 (+) Transcript_2667:55-1257(+)